MNLLLKNSLILLLPQSILSFSVEFMPTYVMSRLLYGLHFLIFILTVSGLSLCVKNEEFDYRGGVSVYISFLSGCTLHFCSVLAHDHVA